MSELIGSAWILGIAYEMVTGELKDGITSRYTNNIATILFVSIIQYFGVYYLKLLTFEKEIKLTKYSLFQF